MFDILHLYIECLKWVIECKKYSVSKYEVENIGWQQKNINYEKKKNYDIKMFFSLFLNIVVSIILCQLTDE